MANNEYSFDTDMVSRLIRKRRTIKPCAYDDRPVPKAVIEKIIENAHECDYASGGKCSPTKI